MKNSEQLMQYHDLIAGIVAALEARDPYTGCHSMRVADMSVQLCNLLGLPEDTTTVIHIAAHLHDIGKIGIEDSILRKPGRLTQKEWQVIQSHAEIGCLILRKVECFSGIAQIVLHHHERWNGTGYPAGLKANDIPFGSRIIAVADSIDAMMSSRSYRNSMTSEQCRAQIEVNIGAMYDPQIAKVALENWNTIVESRNDFNADEISEYCTLFTTEQRG
jgi:putative nucleotidyltransferase with HDIG domain